MLYAAAGEKYEAALKIEPDFHEALDNWGTVLLTQARARDFDQASDLLDVAWEKCQTAETLVPGVGAYNLACISALRGDEDACERWLETSLSHGKFPPRDHLLNDPDLARVRATGWFQALVPQR